MNTIAFDLAWMILILAVAITAALAALTGLWMGARRLLLSAHRRHATRIARLDAHQLQLLDHHLDIAWIHAIRDLRKEQQ